MNTIHLISQFSQWKLYRKVFAAMLATLMTVTFGSAVNVFAQQLPSNVGVNVSSASSFSAGTEKTVATATLTYNGTGGIYVYDLPLNVSANGGASFSNLSNCRVFDQTTGIALSNAGITPTSANSFSLGSAGVRVAANAPTVLAVHCDIASAIPSGGSFQFSSGSGGTSTGTLSVTTSAVSGTIVPGSSSQQTLANVAIQNSSTGSLSVSQLPLSITAGGGANLSTLSSCQLYDQNGNALNTSSNVLNNVQSSNTINVDSSLTVAGNSTTNLTLRCNVAGGFPSGGTLQFGSGGTIGTTVPIAPAPASLVVATPALGVTTVQPGAQDALLATMTLGAGPNNDVQITSLPITVTTGNGAVSTNLTDCRVRNIANGSILNTGSNVPSIVGSGVNTLTLDAPFTITRGTTAALAVTCDVSPFASSGGSFLLGVAPSSLAASAGGSAITPTGSGPGSVVTVASAGVPTTPPTVPGVPNTGAGGNAMLTLFTLLLSAGVVIGGTSLYLGKKVV